MKLTGDVVRSFQMPLFFIASGFLFSEKESWASFIKKKTIRLLLPYLAFSVIAVILRMTFAYITDEEIESIKDSVIGLFTGSNYWFLYSLFIVMVLVKIIKSYKLKIVVAAISVLTIMFTDVFSVDMLTSGRSCYYIFYFILGVLLNYKYEFIITNNIFKLSLYILLICLLFYFSFLPPLRSSYLVFRYLQPIFGSALAWLLSILLIKYRLVNRFLSHFGRYSLQYYLNHLLVIKVFYIAIGRMNLNSPIILLILICGLTIFTSYIMLRIQIILPQKIRNLCGLQ